MFFFTILVGPAATSVLLHAIANNVSVYKQSLVELLDANSSVRMG
jgi:hypothetical protein